MVLGPGAQKPFGYRVAHNNTFQRFDQDMNKHTK